MIHGIVSSAQQEKTRERLEVKVQRCYKYKEQLNFKDREKIFYTDMDTLLQEDTRIIRAWVKLAVRIIKITKKELLKPTNAKKLMENYFQWRPRSNKPMRSPAELHPD
jgi:hypothetical protein